MRRLGGSAFDASSDGLTLYSVHFYDGVPSTADMLASSMAVDPGSSPESQTEVSNGPATAASACTGCLMRSRGLSRTFLGILHPDGVHWLETGWQLMYCHWSSIGCEGALGCIVFVILMLRLAWMGLTFGSWDRTVLRWHCYVASGDVAEEDSVVDADGKEDPKCVLLFTEDVGVDQDQQDGDGDEASDVTHHLSCAVPGQLQVQRFGHFE